LTISAKVVLLTPVAHNRRLQSTHYNSALGSPVVGKNQTRVPQLAQQFRMLLGKELESSRLVRLNAGDIQNNCGEAGNLRIVRLRHPFKAGDVPFGDVRLLKEREDALLIHNGLALALRPGLATLAHMDSVTFAGELLLSGCA